MLEINTFKSVVIDLLFYLNSLPNNIDIAFLTLSSFISLDLTSSTLFPSGVGNGRFIDSIRGFFFKISRIFFCSSFSELSGVETVRDGIASVYGV